MWPSCATACLDGDVRNRAADDIVMMTTIFDASLKTKQVRPSNVKKANSRINPTSNAALRAALAACQEGIDLFAPRDIRRG